jgi:hypothetical protein
MKSKFCNEVINMKNIKSQRGFVLLVAIIACAILAALGFLVFSLSTGDLRTSVSTVGEKKALGAVESGYHLLTQSFDPLPIPHFSSSLNSWHDVDNVNAPGTQYNVSSITLSSSIFTGPLPIPGYTLDNAGGFGMARYDLQLTGRDTIYHSEMSADVGLAYGPVSLKLIYQ